MPYASSRARAASSIAALHLLALGPACEKRVDRASDAPTVKASASAASVESTSTHTYTLYFDVQKDPEGGVTVELSSPDSWTDSVDPMGGPRYGGNGLRHGPDVVLLPIDGPPAQRVETWISRHYDATTLAAAARQASADGSVWIVSRRADGYVDARRYLAAPGGSGVVVCVVTLTPAEAPRLEAVQRVCSSLRLR